MVCKCSLVERLDLLPIAVLLMIGGKLPAKTGKIRSLRRAFTTCLLDPSPPRSHVGLVLFVEVAEEEGPGEPLTLKPGQALGIVELLIAEARRLRRPVAGKPRVNR